MLRWRDPESCETGPMTKVKRAITQTDRRVLITPGGVPKHHGVVLITRGSPCRGYWWLPPSPAGTSDLVNVRKSPSWCHQETEFKQIIRWDASGLPGIQIENRSMIFFSPQQGYRSRIDPYINPIEFPQKSSPLVSIDPCVRRRESWCSTKVATPCPSSKGFTWRHGGRWQNAWSFVSSQKYGYGSSS